MIEWAVLPLFWTHVYARTLAYATKWYAIWSGDGQSKVANLDTAICQSKQTV